MKIRQSMNKKASRHAYINSYQDGRLALQIEAMRDHNEMTQAELGEAIGTWQSRVSEMESGDYDGFSLRSLRNIAEAMDVALLVRFASFDEAFDDCGRVNASEPVPSGYEVPGCSDPSAVVPSQAALVFRAMSAGAWNRIAPSNSIAVQEDQRSRFRIAVAAISSPTARKPTPLPSELVA